VVLDILVQLLLGQGDVAARRLDIGVAEQFLDRAQGRAGLDHVGRHRVPQGVRRGVLNPGDRQILVKRVLHGPRRERLAVLGLDYGVRLLRNGVDRSDVASATLAALHATLDRRVEQFCTIVHTDHHMPPEVVADFRGLGPDWCEQQMLGARRLIEKYDLTLPATVEQHDLSAAERDLEWRPAVDFLSFLRDLAERDARGEDVHTLQVPGELPAGVAD